MDKNNEIDEELKFEQIRKINAEKDQETRKRIAEVQALTPEQKNDKILNLEDENVQLQQDYDKLEDQNAHLRANNFRWSLGCIASLIALSGAVYGLFMQDDQKESYQGQIQTLENELRSAALLDEANSKLIRAVFAKEVIASAGQKADTTPFEAVRMAIASIKEQKSQGNIAIEDFQIRVIGQDLETLAAAAEQTKTNSENFLKAVAVYALKKPNEYTHPSTPVAHSRANLDDLLIKVESKNRVNGQN